MPELHIGEFIFLVCAFCFILYVKSLFKPKKCYHVANKYKLLCFSVMCTDIERRSQNSYMLYTTPCNGVVSSGAPIGGIRNFADHTCRNTNKMYPRSLCAVQHFTRFYLHAETAVHIHKTNHGCFDCGKTRTPPIGAPCQDKDGAGFFDLRSDLWS